MNNTALRGLFVCYTWWEPLQSCTAISLDNQRIAERDWSVRVPHSNPSDWKHGPRESVTPGR